MKVVRVVNGTAPAGSVAIGRGTVWGNPFIIGADGDRDAVVSKFYQYAKWRIEKEPMWLEPLRGKDLACYCSPNMCHGHAIVALLQWEEITETVEEAVGAIGYDDDPGLVDDNPESEVA